MRRVSNALRPECQGMALWSAPPMTVARTAMYPWFEDPENNP